jgi:hypothetical protein
LGANVVLKMLGRIRNDAVWFNIHGAAVSVCTPLDQQQNSIKLALPESIALYIRINSCRVWRAVIQLERFTLTNERPRLIILPRHGGQVTTDLLMRLLLRVR